MSQEKPGQDHREKTDSKSFKQTDEPWKKPVEKEQSPKGASKFDLEEWQKSDTH